MRRITVNARFQVHRPTGMQRYGWELATRFGEQLDRVRPTRALRGAAGHLWEQLYLPSAVRGTLLWSPNNTGPLAVAKQVCTFHDLIPLDRPEWFNPRFAAWYRWLLPRLARQVRHIIAISEFTKQRILERFGVEPQKITVIPNGVDGRFTPRRVDEVSGVRQSLSIPTRHYLLCVGSLEPRKNLGRLLQAWSQVQKQIPDEIWLVVAGAKGASLVFSGVTLASTPPRVHFTDYVNDQDLPALYSGAIALIYPSLYEGFGLPPLEAMACGTPVVTSNTTSLPEVTGNAALLIDPSDIDSIADGIARIVKDSATRQQLRQKGLERVKRITWEQTARRTWDVLQTQAEY